MEEKKCKKCETTENVNFHGMCKKCYDETVDIASKNYEKTKKDRESKKEEKGNKFNVETIRLFKR